MAKIFTTGRLWGSQTWGCVDKGAAKALRCQTRKHTNNSISFCWQSCFSHDLVNFLDEILSIMSMRKLQPKEARDSLKGPQAWGAEQGFSPLASDPTYCCSFCYIAPSGEPESSSWNVYVRKRCNATSFQRGLVFTFKGDMNPKWRGSFSSSPMEISMSHLNVSTSCSKTCR